MENHVSTPGRPAQDRTASPRPPLRQMGCLIAAALALSIAPTTASAQDSDGRLQNGDFLNVWKIQNNSDDQDVPMHWFTSETAIRKEPWIKVLDAPENGVEITGGETSRFLFQDVRIDPSQTWYLRWKVKGSGSASASFYSRDDNENVFPGSSKVTLVDEDYQEDELTIQLPPEATAVRIMIGSTNADSTVTFESIELVAEDGN